MNTIFYQLYIPLHGLCMCVCAREQQKGGGGGFSTLQEAIILKSCRQDVKVAARVIFSHRL